MQISPKTCSGLVLACMTTASLLPAMCDAAGSPGPDKSFLAYFGTYTRAQSKGIYVARFDPATGSFSAPVLAVEAVNPAFLAVHPNQQWLYAANEIEDFDGKRTGAVSAFGIDKATGKLALLNQKPSGGTSPCHLSVDRSGRCAFAANYGSGSVVSFKIDSDGRLSDPVSTLQHRGASVNPQRQSGPHAHCILPDPANRFVLTCDLGLDQVLVSKLESAEARLSAHDPPAVALPPGSGPRHMVFHPSGRFAYVVNELTSTLSSFGYSSRSGTMHPLGTVSALPDKFQGNNSGAEIQIHPSGEFVYTSNRGDDSIAIFAIADNTGVASYIGREPTQGKTPRHFAIDPTGQWLIAENQDSNNVVVFRIDKQTGLLSASGRTFEVGAPVCLVFAGLR